MLLHKKKKDKAFNLLVLKMYDKLWRIIYMHTKDEQITKSILLDTFEKIYYLNIRGIPQREMENLVYKIAVKEVKKRSDIKKGIVL